jgi:hypothetical protein
VEDLRWPASRTLPGAAHGCGDEVVCERWIEKPYYRDLGAAKIRPRHERRFFMEDDVIL